MSKARLIGKWLLALAAFPAAGALFFAVQGWDHPPTEPAPWAGADASGVMRSFFTREYPQNQRFQDELRLMRATDKLAEQNEKLIERLVLTASGELTMPPAVLWCLLFQESRLNHLTGINSDRRAKGLGQFGYFSFHEINHQLGRYTPDNLKMIQNVLGWDIRPIAPLGDQVNSPTSYYYIPTAVTASAAFLNNRYHQLKRILDKRNLTYSPDVLWMFAAMAYNKGTRSVLTYWNQTRAKGGEGALQRLLMEPEALFESLADSQKYTRALSRIWSEKTAAAYAEELTRHMEQVKQCAVDPNVAGNRSNASVKEGS